MSVTSFNYRKARLVKLAHGRIHINYWQTNPATGKLTRFRETFGLNRIQDRDIRLQRAQQKILELNHKLPLGFPYVKSLKARNEESLLEAMQFALSIKLQTDRKSTRHAYRSICSIFLRFMREQGWEKMVIADFTRSHAMKFLDHAIRHRGIGALTYQTYIVRLRALFTELRERDFLDRYEHGRLVRPDNPFSRLPKKKIQAKRRRAFHDEERKAMAAYIQENDPFLWMGVVLQYYCFIRPSELRRLRIHMIRTHEGIIHLPGYLTKNRDASQITIPISMMKFIDQMKLCRYNQNFLLFGKGLQPHPTKPCGLNTLNNHHLKALRRLRDQGLIHNIEGLSFYSWKDTGALQLFKKKVNILEIMRQLRHKDLSTTQRYCQSLYVMNQEIRDLNNELL